MIAGVRPKRSNHLGDPTGIGGWWWHCYDIYRVDCPNCGEKEMCYWLSHDMISDDGVVQGEHHCPSCGFGGELKLIGFKRERRLFPL